MKILIAALSVSIEFMNDMKEMLYPNCSELLANFDIHDPEKCLDIMQSLAEEYGWFFDPPLSLKLLQKMIDETKENNDDGRFSIVVYDKKGNVTSLEYGPNGYDSSLGFRLDSGCDDYDSSQYSFFRAAEQHGAEVLVFDGGHIDGYEEWLEKHEKKV